MHANPSHRDNSVEPARPDSPEARPAEPTHTPPGDGEGYDADVLNEVLDA